MKRLLMGMLACLLAVSPAFGADISIPNGAVNSIYNSNGNHYILGSGDSISGSLYAVELTSSGPGSNVTFHGNSSATPVGTEGGLLYMVGFSATSPMVGINNGVYSGTGTTLTVWEPLVPIPMYLTLSLV